MFLKRLKRLWELSKVVEPPTEFCLEPLNKDKESKMVVIAKNKKRGAIYLPKSDLDEAREAKIAKNTALGKDTLLSELE